MLRKHALKIQLLFHTVTHLSWSQIFFLMYYRLKKNPKVRNLVVKPRTWDKPWDGAVKNAKQSIYSLTRVSFFNEEGELITLKDWNCPKKSKIWLYNLHYFDELTSHHGALQVPLLNQLIEKWMHENPPCKGNGWEPYPLSLRLVNLIKWYSKLGEDPSDTVLTNLALQAQALIQQLEYHIRANHLFVNGKALVFVGAYLKGELANRCLKKGIHILDKEINEQFLRDGGHIELSPMYHASLLWDLCDLIHLSDCSGVAELRLRAERWRLIAQKSLEWLQLMCHPDGGIAFFNDACFGIAPTLQEIQQYCKQLGLDTTNEPKQSFALTWLEDSGYCIVNLDHASKAILDVGKIGPDYQPGHAHADSLSFELSLEGQRVLVNSGISQYGNDDIRQLQRATKAHNTVTIDHKNSSEIWEGFRVARRAYPIHLTTHTDVTQIKISCAHNGYRYLPGRNIHSREWSFLPNKIIIQDNISGLYSIAEARFYFHPDIVAHVLNAQCVQGTLRNGKMFFIKIKSAGKIHIETSKWYPFFGESVENTCLVVQFKEAELITEIEW